MGQELSIIIPCRNGVNYLAEAVASVREQALDSSLEIIVVDDGSTDGTADLARSLGCAVVSIPHSGLSAARNTGLAHAKGDSVLFLDHDDRLRPGALQTLLAALEDAGDADMVLARAQDFVSPELSGEEKRKVVVRPEPYHGLMSGAMLFRRPVFARVKGFDEARATAQTLDFLQQTGQAGIGMRKIDAITVDRRRHLTNMGRTMQHQEGRDHASLLRQRLRGAKRGI